MSGRFTSRPTCSPLPVVVAIPTTWRARSDASARAEAWQLLEEPEAVIPNVERLSESKAATGIKDTERRHQGAPAEQRVAENYLPSPRRRVGLKRPAVCRLSEKRCTASARLGAPLLAFQHICRADCRNMTLFTDSSRHP